MSLLQLLWLLPVSLMQLLLTERTEWPGQGCTHRPYFRSGNKFRRS
jgi:hypothetical protein